MNGSANLLFNLPSGVNSVSELGLSTSVGWINTSGGGSSAQLQWTLPTVHGPNIENTISLPGDSDYEISSYSLLYSDGQLINVPSYSNQGFTFLLYSTRVASSGEVFMDKSLIASPNISIIREKYRYLNIDVVSSNSIYYNNSSKRLVTTMGTIQFIRQGTSVTPVKSGFDVKIKYDDNTSGDTITVLPNSGYQIKRFMVDGNLLVGQNQANVSFNDLLTEHDIVVEFEQIIIEDYNLTTHVGTGNGKVGAEGQIPAYTDITSLFSEGQLVTISADPDPDWFVSSWTNAIAINDTQAQLRMPSSDITVTVNFSRSNVFLTTDIASGDELKGCIGITGHAVCGSGTTVSLSIGSVQVFVEPEDGYAIASWEIDGVSEAATSNFKTINITDNTTVIAHFQDASAPTLVNLTISVDGSGSTTPSPGTNSYVLGSTVVVTALPSYGWIFNSWTGTDGDMTVVGPLQIQITMAGNKSVTAFFQEEVGDINEPDGGGEGGGASTVLSNVFYCPSSNYKSNVVSFDYQNTTGEEERVHFRATFYSDISKTAMVYSAFSLFDIKRWYFDNGEVYPLDKDGIVIGKGDIVNIIYDPEILPQNLFEQQEIKNLNSYPIVEKGLLCGVNYYIDVEVYRTTSSTAKRFQQMTLLIPCKNVENNYWRENNDKKNWLCSGQGKSDLKIGTTAGQCLFPDVSTNLCNLFLVAWQRRETGDSIQVLDEPAKQPIYGAIWDSSEDKLYSSGQGLYDNKYLSMGYRPKILTDQAQNFYVSSYTSKEILAYKCNLPVAAVSQVPVADVFDSLCYPGYGEFLAASSGSIKIRVYEEDIADSLIINKDETIPVVEKKDIKLDITGISGAYAVRLRNASDAQWSDWINIDTNLFINAQSSPPQVITETDTLYDAYFIDNDRFIAPWILPKINGIRRLCCQVLTFYGITKTICVDIFVNLDVLEYKVQFYWDSALAEAVLVKNGYPLLSEKKDINGIPEADSTNIYVKIIFSSEQFYTNLKFNAIQQGVGDQYGLPLTKNDQEGFYTGSFKLYKEDNVFNKDGLGFIDLVFPDDPINVITSCVSDETDKYNLMIREQDVEKFSDLDPEEVFIKNQTNKIAKVLDINSLKQFYDKDDTRFRFGDPGIFRKL